MLVRIKQSLYFKYFLQFNERALISVEPTFIVIILFGKDIHVVREPFILPDVRCSIHSPFPADFTKMKDEACRK